MSDITELLSQAHSGDAQALGIVFDRLYPELRKVASSHVRGEGHTMSPTVLIHEAYLRLLGNEQLTLTDRRHFLACAARTMRGVMVDYIRHVTAAKRGGSASNVCIDDLAGVLPEARPSDDLLALDSALDSLDQVSPRQREIVELRYFAGIEFAAIAELLQCSERTAKREWARARAFLHACMSPDMKF
jgi:RNA polymerase sigma factor (TIGR02999 family)